ncbi:hypothetical protein PHYBLDRAFT_171980 [Phycomyces blakesleeanus NRRL 1555(-)]|uniref:Uncharacterized protein n=1 Tax=Phycomyces blakesleeanus (strain ATCC 8743b / DSM 1359 / FGSC 10004 / NBRC 33097 / NRRL 1555) TaxID=763407 RepID=A0A162ZZ43_PHYB8|nr:hypothetical protein PHYBLDRAFT_171980 [Phycomyces blakesleeanus NRRL 1555(-)]OAD69961.1 hypothetical protein PHYBLDRAFT_171980 [Phycomyces blakesleeanus NRRL 1555(-)]|eukprot:XP_018288001.1 hypothetical protein PHYBLDRAFT_171980 [Phycomyces blakesleeanus NRRL 1555(-)]
MPNIIRDITVEAIRKVYPLKEYMDPFIAAIFDIRYMNESLLTGSLVEGYERMYLIQEGDQKGLNWMLSVGTLGKLFCVPATCSYMFYGQLFCINCIFEDCTLVDIVVRKTLQSKTILTIAPFIRAI